MESYDKLVIATGASPVPAAIPGADLPGVFHLWTIADMDRLEARLKENVKRAVVIGGGFVGVELAENLHERGLEVTVIQRGKQLLPTLDFEMSNLLAAELRRLGIRVELEAETAAFSQGTEGLSLTLKDGRAISADLAVLSIGVKPNSELAGAAGLALGKRGHIVTDEELRTSDPDIYAIGDATSVTSGIDAEPAYIALAGLANKEGRELASYLSMGKDFAISGLGTSILKVFGLAAGSTGFSEEQLKAKGMEYDKIYLSPANHATYYPGASTLLMKVLFNYEGAILGSQVVGKDGVDKRIDVLSIVIKNNLGYKALKDAELAYAPPFGSAKDPINMAGFMIENILTGRVKQFFREDIPSIQADPHNLLVDVRTKGEYDAFHIPMSINIPVDELRDRLSELPKDRHIRLLCHSAIRSYIAARILTQKGYECSHLSGGYVFY